MTTRFIPLSLLCIAALIAIAGCTDDPLYPSRQVTVSAVNLPYLEPGVYYQMWLAYPRDAARSKGSPVIDHAERQFISIGTFRVDPSGALQGVDGGSAAFMVPVGYNPELFSDAILSVQRSDASDSTPGAVLLGGAFVRTGAQSVTRLSLTGGDAFGHSLDSIQQGASSDVGWFLLDTPTTPDDSDFEQGIWFIKSDLKTQGLPFLSQPLNPLNSLWEYEAWLVHHPAGAPPEYISLGRFDSAKGLDRNGPGPGAGSDVSSAYKVPGEDFVADGMKRALSDSSYGVVVSLAPSTITLSRPFIMLLERDTIPAPAVRLQSVGLSAIPFANQPIIDLSFER